MTILRVKFPRSSCSTGEKQATNWPKTQEGGPKSSHIHNEQNEDSISFAEIEDFEIPHEPCCIPDQMSWKQFQLRRQTTLQHDSMSTLGYLAMLVLISSNVDRLWKRHL